MGDGTGAPDQCQTVMMPGWLKLIGGLALIVSIAGCSMRPGMNENCIWPADPDAATSSTSSHLVVDVRIAEELAMRYADARSYSRAEHGRNRSGCEATLFARIEHTHRIDAADIAAARQQLSEAGWDAPVHVPLAALYIAAAFAAARRIRHRFGADEKAPATLATCFVSVVLGLVFLVLGHLWDGVIEMVRVGNTHMSYRVERLGWRESWDEVFVSSVLVFWCTVLLHYRRPHSPPP